MTKSETAANSMADSKKRIVHSLQKLRLLRHPSAFLNQQEEEDFANLSFVEREVLEYNLDLQNWLSAKIERGEENFALLSTQLATGFSAITSNGMQWRRDTMLTELEEAWGSRGVDFTSSILELRIIVQTAVLAVVNYEIHEEANGQQAPRVKCVTAVLALNSRNRNNVEWLHYHESSLPRTAADAASTGT